MYFLLILWSLHVVFHSIVFMWGANSQKNMYVQCWLELNFGYTTLGGGGKQMWKKKNGAYLSYSAKFTKPLATRILQGTRGTHRVCFRIGKSTLTEMYFLKLRSRGFSLYLRCSCFLLASFIEVYSSRRALAFWRNASPNITPQHSVTNYDNTVKISVPWAH